VAACPSGLGAFTTPSVRRVVWSPWGFLERGYFGQKKSVRASALRSHDTQVHPRPTCLPRVLARKLRNFEGFGPSLVSELMAWRQNAINKFIYNAADHSTLLTFLRLEPKSQPKGGSLKIVYETPSPISSRPRISQLINEKSYPIWETGRLPQEANEQRATGPLRKASQFISICCAVLAAIGLMRSGDQSRRTGSVNNPQVATVEHKPPSPAQPTQKPPSLPPPRMVPPNINLPKQDSLNFNPHPDSQPPANDTEGRNKDGPFPFPPIQEIPRLPDVTSVAPQNDALTRDLAVARTGSTKAAYRIGIFNRAC
jgi:hypothetical protein